jgi:riboflavin synthase
MFTGIVTDIGEVAEIGGVQGALKRLRLHARYDPETISVGASIACAGPCLTVVAKGKRPAGCWFEVEAAAETLAVTTIGDWRVGTRVNLERSLKIGDELGGHLVTGHVDGIATILAREEPTDDASPARTARLLIGAPAELAPFIARKGSVALDGVSLTVNCVDQSRFSVLIIPHTLDATTFAARRVGDRLNIEVDLMARYAARLAEVRGGS